MRNLFLGAGAMLLASTAVPAFAHEVNNNGYNSNYNNGYNNNGYNNNGYNNNGYNNNGDSGYGDSNPDVIRQHVSECRQHQQFHQQLQNAHDQQHTEGYDNSQDHQDAHQALNEAHDQYHAENPGGHDCNYWYSQYNNLQNYNNNPSPDQIRWHVRECRRHEQFHQQLSDAHDQQHAEGFDNGQDHHDTHDALNEAHNQFHDTHQGAQDCNYWYSQYNNLQNYGYRHRYYRHGWRSY
jgi:hypothetical protein